MKLTILKLPRKWNITNMPERIDITLILRKSNIINITKEINITCKLLGKLT